MKKIQREVKTYKDVFVSVDGKEFSNETDCKEWEASYNGTMAASWSKIKKIEVNSCSLGVPYSNDDYECYMIKPKDLEEITLINAYVRSATYNNCTTLDASHIGKLVILNFGYDHDYCDAFTLADHLKDITDYAAKIENKMNEIDE